jgi:nicotinate-nucleotide adenylyltransferase
LSYKDRGTPIAQKIATGKSSRPRKPSKIGIFGGTFNPIHLAHLILAEELRERFSFDRVLFIPSGKPPHKRARLTTGHQRLEMVRLAVAGNRSFAALDLEVTREGKSYTIETLRILRRRFPRETEFFFLMGMDAFREITTWREAELFADYSHFVVFPRPDSPLLPPQPFLPPPLKAAAPRRCGPGARAYALAGKHILYMVEAALLPFSASAIRNRAAEGRSLRYLVPEAVEKYIIRHKLYQKTGQGG